MQKYELLLILPGTLDDKEVEARSAEIVAMVSEVATGVELHTMGKSRLAYPVRQIRYGYYFTVTFTAEAKAVKQLEKKFSLMRDVIRAVISHFNINLTAQQQTAYGTEGMMERGERKEAAPTETVHNVQKEVEALMAKTDTTEKTPVESTVSRSLEKVDVESINKKLDDLMSGDIIPGV